ncbi:sensor histidine kinase [Shewanella surugensis]|uniref:histidine kinase n=1 Tax=Shewanella surugensis TaxID=212020 RepID=A0ABT0LDS8_9GAMM|nr:ATP-binding protein [Shewanella surugensis]MCL1125848.1 ATP-binding protein [Shewanella surugensis]
MEKIKKTTLNAVEKDIRFSIVLATLTVFVISLMGYLSVYNDYLNHLSDHNKLELDSALSTYSSSLQHRIGIIVSSTEFMEFIRSGAYSRQQLSAQMIEVFSRQPQNEIVGWNIDNNEGVSIFSLGTVTKDHAIFPLCYLGDTLYAEYGQCQGSLFIYLSEDMVINKLMKIDPSIVICRDCHEKILTVMSPSVFGVKYFVDLPITIKFDDHIYHFILFLCILFSSLFVVGWLARRKVRKTLQLQIINPLLGISKLHYSSDYGDSTVQEIMDIRYRQELHVAKAVVEAERDRKLANEIHDMFGSILLLLRWKVEILQEDNSAYAVDEALIKIDEMINLTQNIIESLRPETLDTLGLSASLQHLVDDWALKNDQCRYVLVIEILESEVINDAVEFAIYRILQEALTNIDKHAIATEVNIDIMVIDYKNSKNISMTIADNGVGIVESHISTLKGLGLSSMKERAVLLGGEFEINSASVTGTVIKVSIPLNQIK